MNIPDTTSDYALQKALRRRRATPISAAELTQFKDQSHRAICTTVLRSRYPITDAVYQQIRADVEDGLITLMDETASIARVSAKEIAIEFEYPPCYPILTCFDMALHLSELEEDFEVVRTFKYYQRPQLSPFIG